MTRMRRSDERGFTLIELAVVFIVVAILILIAIPVFLGIRGRSEDTAAKESAVLAVRVALGIGDTQTFGGVTTASLQAAEPSLTFVDGTQSSTGFRVVSQLIPDAGAGDSTFVAAVKSASGACFMARQEVTGTEFAQAAVPNCRASDHGSMTFGPTW
jgi:prepilin-type N-terminal cleavage/methylation domain-containing protein